MKNVDKKDYLRVLCCLDKGSVAMVVVCGLKVDDIEEFELNRESGWIRVINGKHLMNLKVKVSEIDWEE